MCSLECTVINSSIKRRKSYDFVAYDEIHEYLRGEEFSKTFSMLESPAKLGLSGTILEDDREYLESLGMPVFSSMSREEGLARGFLTPTYIYNLRIPLTIPEIARMREYNKAIAIESGKLPKFYTECLDPNSDTVQQHSRMTGMKPGEIVGIAMKLQRMVQKRNDFLDKNPKKIEAFKGFVERFLQDPDAKILTFSKNTEMANMLTELYPSISKSYHSNIPGELWEGESLAGKIWKKEEKKGRKSSFRTVYLDLEGNEIDEGRLKKLRKVSQKACRERIMSEFRDGTIRILNSAEALKVGIDVPDVRFVYEVSGSSNRRDFQQKVGRIREIGIYVRAFMDGSHQGFKTKDQETIEKAQEGLSGIEYILDINQI